MFRGARYGRTVLSPELVSVHLTCVGGHTWRGQGAGAGHTVGAGHLTSGQRARGQGGHSPASFVHAELSIITGCCRGILLFSTYLLRSGTGGQVVLSMYWLMSGGEGQGGTVDLRTYLLMSGCRQGGHTSCWTRPCAAAAGVPGGGHEHWGAFFWQLAQMGTPAIPLV